MKPQIERAFPEGEAGVCCVLRRQDLSTQSEADRGTMATAELRIGIAGGGLAARIHLDRLLALDGVAIVGCADPRLPVAQALADRATRPARGGGQPAPVAAFTDHRELLRQLAPDALAIFTHHLSHYRSAMDALQAGCHVFIEKPLSTSVQEAADIVGLARGRQLKVAVGHQYRLCPSLIEARRRIAAGSIGSLRLVTALLARPRHSPGPQESTRLTDPDVAGNGILTGAGDHLIDALLWTTGRVARDVAAVQSQDGPGLDVVTAAAITLADGTPVSLALSGVAPGPLFCLDYFGEQGRLRATDQTLEEEPFDTPKREVTLPPENETIDGNFVAALRDGTPLCCPADQAIDAVRLQEAIGRSAATGQVVRLI
jgi:predicted dehydrogenase